MSQICNACGEDTEHYFMKQTLEGKFYVECKICNQPRHSAPCTNPYSDLTLTHVHDDEGKPVRVTSKRQLLQAEKRYNFRSLVAHMNEENFDKPLTKPVPEDPRDRIAHQLSEQVGRRDHKGNKLGFLHPEMAIAQLKELKEKNISIEDW